MRKTALTLLFIAGCARASSDAVAPATPSLPPNRRPPPEVAYSSDKVLLRERVAEAIALHSKDRWEQFVDAIDPGELAGDLRADDSDIAAGRWTKEQLFQLGDDIFEHDFGAGEGFGPGLSRIQNGSKFGGPDAGACAECHHRGGFNGSGDLSENAFFDGDGTQPSSAFERNPPHVLGLGIEERLAVEMTADLQRQRQTAEMDARAIHGAILRALSSKGVSFGALAIRADGTADFSGLRGVDPDLVVKPFGWKGAAASLREFATNGFQVHFGIQFSRPEARGTGPEWDRDADGLPNEITDGMMSAIVVYLSRLETPVMIPPRDPGLLERHGHGAQLFGEIGCASCHVPSLPLEDPRLQIAPGIVSDVIKEGEQPRPRFDVYADSHGGTPIFLFSDLKRHSMGPQLAEVRPTILEILPYNTANSRVRTEIPADVFLTRPLWGLAETAPYLHDGRASTLDDAILAHGGEAATSSTAFKALKPSDKADLRIFLLSLSRYPRIDFK